ncbi:hypothetical protein H5410_035129 [Solanum commersonii]|uniref:Uncharacterized protein n=1 Tax=Solanum commersonii TaxID=4109 RepID=A0A9J5Y0C9_SOLCO|nr:hypothetical protein H5410_035129 [Solanum commersonii]
MSWSLGTNGFIFKFKQASKYEKLDFIDFRVLIVHKFLVIQNSSLKKWTHFQVQMIPKAGKIIFYRFSCAIVRGFFVIKDFNLFLDEIFHKRDNSTHFQVQTSSKVGKIIFFQFSCAIVHGYFVIQNFGLFLAENFHGQPLKPY